MKVKDEINTFASEQDKPILNWLFARYHWESQWTFVATCTFKRYGTESYKVNRIWTPTIEGKAIYDSLANK